MSPRLGRLHHTRVHFEHVLESLSSKWPSTLRGVGHGARLVKPRILLSRVGRTYPLVNCDLRYYVQNVAPAVNPDSARYPFDGCIHIGRIWSHPGHLSHRLTARKLRQELIDAGNIMHDSGGLRSGIGIMRGLPSASISIGQKANSRGNRFPQGK